MMTEKERLNDIRGEVEASDIFETIMFCFDEWENYLPKEKIKNEIISTVADMIEGFLKEEERRTI